MMQQYFQDSQSVLPNYNNTLQILFVFRATTLLQQSGDEWNSIIFPNFSINTFHTEYSLEKRFMSCRTKLECSIWKIRCVFSRTNKALFTLIVLEINESSILPEVCGTCTFKCKCYFKCKRRVGLHNITTLSHLSFLRMS